MTPFGGISSDATTKKNGGPAAAVARNGSSIVLRLSAIVRGESTAQAGLDMLALDLQAILGKRVRLRFPVQARVAGTKP